MDCRCPPFDCAGLVRDFLVGDNSAGDKLANHYRALVATIIRKRLSSRIPDDRDEASQQAFLQIFARLGTWEGRSPLCHWVAVVTARIAYRWPRNPLPPRELATEPEDRERMERIRTCLEKLAERLPPDLQQVLQWCREGLPRREMAKRLDISERAVFYRIGTMLQLLRVWAKRESPDVLD